MMMVVHNVNSSAELYVNIIVCELTAIIYYQIQSMQMMSVGKQNKLFKPLNILILAFNHSLIHAAQIQQFIHVNIMIISSVANFLHFSNLRMEIKSNYCSKGQRIKGYDKCIINRNEGSLAEGSPPLFTQI